MDGRLVQGAQQVALSQWAGFIAKCLAQRKESGDFEKWMGHLALKYPLPPGAVADLFLRPQAHNNEFLDPRIPRYLHILSTKQHVDTASILEALYKYSTSHTLLRDAVDQSRNGDDGIPDVQRWRSSYGAEEVMFYRLTKAVAQDTAIQGTEDALKIGNIMSKWMTLFTDVSAAFTMDAVDHISAEAAQARDEMESARAAFVALLLGVCENPVVLKALSRPESKSTRQAMSQGLSSFVPTIMHNADRIATRLDLFRTNTLASFDPDDEGKEIPKTGMDHLFDNTVDLEHFVVSDFPIVNSRAGLYVYVNAALVGRPLMDDTAIFSYLNNRYQGDVQSATVDLILASFDVLANAVFRNEGKQAAHVLRSHIMNKLPLLIASLSKHMFPPLTAEYCITDALRRVDANAFPTLSSMFEESRSNNPFTDSAREEFCWACCLHGLLPESSIETILGETPYQSLPSRGRYVMDTLVTECLADSERVISLVGELDSMDGNVGAACQTITEVLGQLCRNKDTMPLKNLCSHLARKPLSFDVILLFNKPATILHPLCELLDAWKYEEDQGEYQPVYEEFGSVLLLLLAFAHRYNLSPADVGVKASDSFVTKLLSQGHLSNKPADELSEQERSHLDGWIKGLFDQEAGGLTDDLISSCPPQEFYLLVPTLFQNIVLAFSLGYLSEEALKGGVEFLVDTFLLPSLVPAITYLANRLWVDRANQKAVLRILQMLIQPNTISSEASTMHASVLNIIAKPLEHSLRAYQRQDPQCQEVEPLLRTLKEHIPLSRRTGGADHNELESWSGVPNGGLTAAVRHTMQGLIQWSLQAGINTTPTPYTHRQILVAQKMLGAKRLLHIILDELRQQMEQGSGSVAYDVATALVCAPDVTNSSQTHPLGFIDDNGSGVMAAAAATASLPAPQKKLSLRDVLRYEAEDCRRLQREDPGRTEMVVKLHRKVEGQMVISAQPEDIQAGGILPGDLGLGMDGGAESLDNAMAAAAVTATAGVGVGVGAGAAPGGGMGMDNVSLDLGIGAMGGDLGLGDGTGGAMSLDLGADDMFSGLSGGGDFEWDSMDLG